MDLERRIYKNMLFKHFFCIDLGVKIYMCPNTNPYGQEE